MNSKSLQRLLVLALAAAAMLNAAFAQEDPALFLGRANAKVAKAMAFRNQWDGPTSGPKIEKKGLIVFIGSDFRDNAIASLANGVREASAASGWGLQVLDCYGIPSRRAEAFSRAMALKPLGIVLAGIDASEQPKELKAAAALKIPVIGWHAAIRPGPAEGLFTNIGADARESGQIAAWLSVVESKGKAGVVVFTDSAKPYSAAKANAIVEIVKHCQTCTLLGVQEIPLLATADQLQQQLAALVKRHGSHWTHAIATSDQNFDLMAAPAAAAIISANHVQAIGAGDGSSAAYQRIRNKVLQIGTIPEPLNMQGWQLVDEINRAASGDRPSGFTTSVYLVTIQNNAFHGGPKNMFEPAYGYRGEYKKIWMK